MSKLAVMVVASLVLVSAAWAQRGGSFGSADPSQQLKTAGMDMNNPFQRQTSQPTVPDQKKEPLVQGTQDTSGDATPSGQASAQGNAGGAPVQQADTSANASAYGSTTASDDQHRRRERKYRRGRHDEARAEASATTTVGPATSGGPAASTTAGAGVTSWNPAASAGASAAAGAAPGDQHMQKIQGLIAEIKQRRSQAP